MKKGNIIVHEPPVIDLGAFEFSESVYTRGREHWMATTCCISPCLLWTNSFGR